MAGAFYDATADTNMNNSWPLAKFYFRLTCDKFPDIGFQAIEGLESEVSVMEYRPGNAAAFYKSKRPGMTSYSNITLKKGMFRQHADLFNWYKAIAQEHQYRAEARQMVIEMLNELGEVVLTWRVSNCIVTKFTPTGLDAEADSEVAIEELELACDFWNLEFS